MIDSIRTGLASLWSNKVRSLLNIVGVVIGVASVTILVSLSEGLKRDVSTIIQGLGTNVIALVSGKIEPGSGQTPTNPANFISGDILTFEDVEALEVHPEIEAVSPITVVSGSLRSGEKVTAPVIFAMYPNFLDLLTIYTLDKGRMYGPQDEAVIVLGYQTARDLFGEGNPVGQTVTLGKTELTVVGSLAKVKASSFIGTQYDSFGVIPFDTATKLNRGQVKIMRIFARARAGSRVEAVKEDIRRTILKAHDGEEDFSLLTQDDMLELFDTFLGLATTLVSAIAAISLIVGGIGIMNIMLVTVTERTREIGIRKAVGATKWAILVQFLTEAIIVTFIGALIGLAIAFLAGAVVAAKTELNPVITPQIILLAVGISVGIGLVFGLWPAARAANKDPIEALRYE